MQITRLTKHQFYHRSQGVPPGKRPTIFTIYRDPSTGQQVEKPNETLVEQNILILSDTDMPNWYRTVTTTLQVQGWYVNHKKVYRLEKENGLLGKPRKKKGRTFVKFRRVNPLNPLRVLEMDIKYSWVAGSKSYAYILTVLDTFTRYALHWSVGYQMRQEQVKDVWGYVIANYLQPADLLSQGIDIEIRNDNGKQFCAEMIQTFFKENYLSQVFTHPYSPEENGHVESFHKTLGASLKDNQYKDLEDLTQRLKQFYTTYNNKRHHGSIARLSPSIFWALWENDLITMKTHEKKKATFKLKIPYQEVMAVQEIDKYTYRVMGI